MNPLSPSFTNEDLLKLKECFKEEINSNRRFEEISTVDELFDVLEDRDALTDDVLLGVNLNFQEFVQLKRNKVKKSMNLGLPQAVVRVIVENYLDEWEKLGQHLKLSDEQINSCQSVEDVLINFLENCKGISPQEMRFRLVRALEKSGKGSLRDGIVDLMR